MRERHDLPSPNDSVRVSLVPVISIVTITFNNFEELLLTQESLRGLEGIERIVINGGSCPRTRAWLEQQPSIRSLSEADRGISDAFSKGARLASGEFVTFLNSGDILHERDYYARAVAHLAAHPRVDFVHSDMLFGDPLAGEMRMRPLLKNLGRGMPYWFVTMVFRRSLFTELGYFRDDYRIAMDYDLICRMTKHKKSGAYLPSASVRMDGQGVSQKAELRAVGECWRALVDNHVLNGPILAGFLLRVALLGGKRTALALGLRPLVKQLKRLKQA